MAHMVLPSLVRSPSAGPGPFAAQLHAAAPEFEHLLPGFHWRSGPEPRTGASPVDEKYVGYPLVGDVNIANWKMAMLHGKINDF